MESSLSSGSIGPSPSISSAVSLVSWSSSRALSGTLRLRTNSLHDRADFVEDLVLGRGFQRGEIEPVDQMTMQLDLEGEKSVTVGAFNRNGGRRRHQNRRLRFDARRFGWSPGEASEHFPRPRASLFALVL